MCLLWMQVEEVQLDDSVYQPAIKVSQLATTSVRWSQENHDIYYINWPRKVAKKINI